MGRNIWHCMCEREINVYLKNGQQFFMVPKGYFAAKFFGICMAANG